MSALVEYWPELVEGLGLTVLITVLGLVMTVVVAFAAGLARLSRLRILRVPAYVFVEIFRGTSLVVQLFWFFYALPILGIEFTPIAAAVLVLGLNEGAYAAEIVRGTIASRPKGQKEACIALGMGPALRMRRVLIPQSIPAMLPSFGNVFVDLLKATSLVSLVTIADLTFAAQTARNFTGDTAAIFATILVVYFTLSMLLAGLTRALERRFAIDRRARPGKRPIIGGGQGAIPV
jgi:polar amino acid transport system permease protein